MEAYIRRDRGPVRAEGLALAFRRYEMEKVREAAKANAGKAPVAEPVVVPRPISGHQAVEDIAKMLMDSYESATKAIPYTTLDEFLDGATSKVFEKAWKRGNPIRFEDVRTALGNLYERGQRERGKIRPVETRS